MRFFTLHFYDKLTVFKRSIIKLCNAFLFWISLLAMLITIYRFGFSLTESMKQTILSTFNIFIIVFFSLTLIRFMVSNDFRDIRKIPISESLLILFLFLICSVKFFFPHFFTNQIPQFLFLKKPIFGYIATAVVFVVEFSRNSITMLRPTLKPAIIILLSFVVLILFGSGLLLLPKATTNSISVIDAFFTSTSAVCVTGLVVVDTAATFTPLGKGIILLLIQLGGLGIMTFTFFFGFFFRGSTSFQSQLFLKDALNETDLGQVFKTILKIVIFTLLVEAIGAYFLYLVLDGGTVFRIKTALFHSISAFCNAGFSTFSNGLLDSAIGTNYSFHLIIAIMIIIGGLGYPVIFSYYLLLKHFIRSTIRRFLYPSLGYQHKPNVINAGIRLIVYTTFWLLLCGTIFFLMAEWNYSLSTLPWHGKLVTAFFGSVTPRTAGFNSVDYAALRNSTILITMLLMWIGASPGSTGGGIKTSTFTVAILNAISIARGKGSVEYLKTEFSSDSIRRAFAVILLSILVIGLSVFFVNLFENDIDFRSIVFECISAFSTVGLSLGVTSSFGTAAKIVIIITMFIGRVGALTILIGILRKVNVKSYRYPTENVLIN